MINYEKHGILFKLLDIDDMPDFDISPFFDESNPFIHEGITNQEGVLVVCTAGISRSAAIVIAYLMKMRDLKYAEAHKLVK
jgi:protein-tyrosine phosphatase